jgi:uncharacterized membrane protein
MNDDLDPGQQRPPAAPPQFVAPGGQLEQPYPYYAYPPRVPTNNLAVASIITSCCSLGLLLISLGLFAPVCLIASVIGTILGHKGKVAFDEGRAAQQRDLSIAGFWVGMAGWILSLLAIIAWIVVIVVLSNLDWTFDESTGTFNTN